MRVLNLTGTVTEDHRLKLNLDLPVEFAPGSIEVLVVMNGREQTAAPETSAEKSVKPKYDFSDLLGTLHVTEDPVAIQRRLRDEW